MSSKVTPPRPWLLARYKYFGFKEIGGIWFSDDPSDYGDAVLYEYCALRSRNEPALTDKQIKELLKDI